MENNTQKSNKPIYKKWWFWVIAAVLLLSIISKLNNDGDKANISLAATNIEAKDIAATDIAATDVVASTPTLETTTNPTATPLPYEIYDSGMYKVGSEIPAGEYFILASGSGYYSVTSDSSGSFDSILANNNFETFSILTVETGNYLEISRAEMCLVSDIFSDKSGIDPIHSFGYNNADGTYGPGMYKVGLTIPSGEFKLSPYGGNMAYLAVTSDSKGIGIDSTITNDNFDGDKYITVEDGQYLTVIRATIIPVE